MINVDKIVTISLKESLERQSSTARELEKLRLKSDFYLAERDKGHEERGCFHSHQQVSNHALQDPNCRSLLVLEDDVKILPFSPIQLQQINLFLQRKADQFDILYLGLIIDKMWFSGWRHIVRAKGTGAHAYILSRRGMEKFAAYRYDGTPVDKVFKHDFTCYSSYPMIAEQFPKEVFASALAASRNDPNLITDARFWLTNSQKQKGILWRNALKTLFSFWK